MRFPRVNSECFAPSAGEFFLCVLCGEMFYGLFFFSTGGRRFSSVCSAVNN